MILSLSSAVAPFNSNQPTLKAHVMMICSFYQVLLAAFPVSSVSCNASDVTGILKSSIPILQTLESILLRFSSSFLKLFTPIGRKGHLGQLDLQQHLIQIQMKPP